MNDLLAKKLYELKDLIKELDEYKDVKEKESIMENDSLFKIKSNEFEMAKEKYNDALRFNLDTKESLKNLSIIKSELYSLKTVDDYLKSYKKLGTILKLISKKLIDGVLYESNSRKV